MERGGDVWSEKRGKERERDGAPSRSSRSSALLPVRWWKAAARTARCGVRNQATIRNSCHWTSPTRSPRKRLPVTVAILPVLFNGGCSSVAAAFVCDQTRFKFGIRTLRLQEVRADLCS